MATTRNIPIEHVTRSSDSNSRGGGGGGGFPQTKTIQVQRQDHPFRNGLPTITPMLYPSRQDDRFSESPEPPHYVNTSYARASPSADAFYPTARSYSPTGGFTQTFISSPPANTSPANQTAPLPRSAGISLTYDRPKQAGEGGGFRIRTQPQEYVATSRSAGGPYQDDQSAFHVAPKQPNIIHIQRAERRSDLSPEPGRSSPSSPFSGRQPQQPQPQHYSSPTPTTPTSPISSPISPPISPPVSTVKSPPPVTGEGVRSKLLYTAPAPQQGVVQSRPTAGSAGTRPPGGNLQTTHSPTLSYSAPARDTAANSAKGDEEQGEDEVDALTDLLMQNMDAASDPEFFGPCSYCGRVVKGQYNACKAFDKVFHIQCFRCFHCGMCARCNKAIMGENTGCSALDQLYHLECFSCNGCGECLGGQPFFAMEGKPYCESCYLNTLEKCSVCSKPITDRILRATGKPYHPGCFTCVVCSKSLDGVPFTVDATNQIHCIQDFHKKFAPRCCVCNDPIMPERGQEETVRIVAMDRSFHVNCYTCEDCGMVLSSEEEGRGCYPLDDHILCKNCNAKRIQTMSSKMTTEL